LGKVLRERYDVNVKLIESGLTDLVQTKLFKKKKE